MVYFMYALTLKIVWQYIWLEKRGQNLLLTGCPVTNLECNRHEHQRHEVIYWDGFDIEGNLCCLTRCKILVQQLPMVDFGIWRRGYKGFATYNLILQLSCMSQFHAVCILKMRMFIFGEVHFRFCTFCMAWIFFLTVTKCDVWWFRRCLLRLRRYKNPTVQTTSFCRTGPHREGTKTKTAVSYSAKWNLVELILCSEKAPIVKARPTL